MDAIDAIRHRRSIGKLAEPAPDDNDIELLLEAAVSAPDHKELQPWRFFVLRGDAKSAFGAVMADALVAREPNATPGMIDKELHKLDRAPLVIAAGTIRIPTSLPFEELFAATSAAIQNLLIAATALGFGSMWRTGDLVYDPVVKEALGLQPEDAVNGFIYLGTAAKEPEARFPTLDGVVTEWRP